MTDVLTTLGDPVGGTFGSRVRLGLRIFPLALRFLLDRRRLWGWAAAPIAIVVVLAVVAGFAATAGFAPLILWVHHARAGWSGLVAVTAIFVGLLVSAVAGFVLYLLVNVIAVPFHDGLSERVEAELTGALLELDWGQWAWSLFWSAAHSLLTLALWGSIVLFSLGLEFVPGIGTVLGMVFGSAASAVFLARETMDGPMSRRQMGYLAKFRFLFRHAAVTGSWGMLIAVLMWVPVVNVLMLPVAMVGGTVLFCAIQRSDPAAERANR